MSRFITQKENDRQKPFVVRQETVIYEGLQ